MPLITIALTMCGAFIVSQFAISVVQTRAKLETSSMFFCSRHTVRLVATDTVLAAVVVALAVRIFAFFIVRPFELVVKAVLVIVVMETSRTNCRNEDDKNDDCNDHSS